MKYAYDLSQLLCRAVKTNKCYSYATDAPNPMHLYHINVYLRIMCNALLTHGCVCIIVLWAAMKIHCNFMQYSLHSVFFFFYLYIVCRYVYAYKLMSLYQTMYALWLLCRASASSLTHICHTATLCGSCLSVRLPSLSIVTS